MEMFTYNPHHTLPYTHMHTLIYVMYMYCKNGGQMHRSYASYANTMTLDIEDVDQNNVIKIHIIYDIYAILAIFSPIS